MFFITFSFIIFTSLLSFKVNAKDIPDFTLMPIYVNRGDSLWCISVENAPDNMDVRDYLDNIIKINNLNSVIIQPGQLLYIPFY